VAGRIGQDLQRVPPHAAIMQRKQKADAMEQKNKDDDNPGKRFENEPGETPSSTEFWFGQKPLPR
jgi:hypothetical protein